MLTVSKKCWLLGRNELKIGLYSLCVLKVCPICPELRLLMLSNRRIGMHEILSIRQGNGRRADKRLRMGGFLHLAAGSASLVRNK